jgi:serine/threonine-protein kinase RsbW
MILLQVPGELRYRGLVVRAVAATCKLARDGRAGEREDDGDDDLDLSDQFDAEMVSALSEAFNNIAIHAYAGRSAGQVLIEADLLDDCLLLQIKDYGASLDRSSVAEPDLDALPEGGMGLFIVRSFVDEFRYEPGTPNLWSLRKYLPGRRP